jgi:hypothetical protein
LRRAFRVLGIGLAVVAVAIVAAHFIWKYSGSNEWKKRIDKNGITVWSRKTPGSTLMDIKALRLVKTRVPVALTSFMGESCDDFVPGCISGRDIEPWNARELSSTGIWVVKFPFPLAPREYLLKTQISQDPNTKAAMMRVTALPDLLPRNKCCYRIPVVDNRWLFTPRGDGNVEVLFTMHMDQGLPYFMVNMMTPKATYKIFDELPAHFGKPKYQNAKLDYIKE